MKLKVCKWGDSLAIVLPKSYIKTIRLNEGDTLEVSISAEGEITLTPQNHFNKKKFIEKIKALHQSMPMTAMVSRKDY